MACGLSKCDASPEEMYEEPLSEFPISVEGIMVMNSEAIFK